MNFPTYSIGISGTQTVSLKKKMKFNVAVCAELSTVINRSSTSDPDAPTIALEDVLVCPVIVGSYLVFCPGIQ